MKKISSIGTLVKKIYRNYSMDLLLLLEGRGFTDLRPSFLEVLLFICEHEGVSIKEIGMGCGLKKQTMTTHLNELEKRGYIDRRLGLTDKREQNIFLTDYGVKFKYNFFESINEVEEKYVHLVGGLELHRAEIMLKNFYTKLQ